MDPEQIKYVKSVKKKNRNNRGREDNTIIGVVLYEFKKKRHHLRKKYGRNSPLSHQHFRR